MSNLNQFSAVEQLDEVARNLGWDIEYRQLGKGEFFAEITALDSGGIQFTSERFDNHLCIYCVPPPGFVGLFLPNAKIGHLQTCGRALTDGNLIAFPTSSEMDFITRYKISNEAIFLSAIDFDAAARAIAPSIELLRGEATIFQGNPERLSALRRELSLLIQKGSLDSETASNILAKTITWMIGAATQINAERLTSSNAVKIARSARTFIEENLQNVIRLQDLCIYTGVSLRTLERSFENYFQISPLNYIKVRRLNAVRRELVAAESSNTSVTTLATKYGFNHLGRFSIDYRAHFAESPSKTLAAR